MAENIYKKIELFVRGASKVLIITHEKPDGDALGSVFGISKYLEKLNKDFQIFLSGNNGFNNANFLHNTVLFDEIDWKEIDLIISLDAGDLPRTGIKETVDKWSSEMKIINIDHHISNEYFGDVNLVDSKASSTTQILMRMFEYFEFDIDKRLAKALLLGILTDTDNFSNKGTTPEAFEMAARLLRKGANMGKINIEKKGKTMDALKIWGNSFKRLKKNEKYGVTYTLITKEELKKAEEEGFSENVEDLVNFFNNLKDSKFAMVLKEQEDDIKISLRTTYDNVDVARLASFFGGGGHQKAAGFSIKGKIKRTPSGWTVV